LKTPKLAANGGSGELWRWRASRGITNASDFGVEEMMQDRCIDVADNLSLAAS